jgi:DNA-binding response OmpR family regulator
VRVLTDALNARRRVLRCGTVPFVVQGRAVEIDGAKVDLPPRERAVLEVLLDRRGTVVSKSMILRSLGSDPAGVHALEATIGRMRRHLGPAGASIRAVRGRGYCLDLEELAIAN